MPLSSSISKERTYQEVNQMHNPNPEKTCSHKTLESPSPKDRSWTYLFRLAAECKLAGKDDIFIYHKFENTEKLQIIAKNIHL